MLPLVLYSVQWETQARRRQERTVEARHAWLSRAPVGRTVHTAGGAVPAGEVDPQETGECSGSDVDAGGGRQFPCERVWALGPGTEWAQRPFLA